MTITLRLKVMTTCSVLWIGLLTLACHKDRPRIRVGIERAPTGEAFQFSFWPGEGQDDPGVYQLEVVKVESSGSVRQWCTLYAADSDKSLGRTWFYGQTRSGFRMEDCSALKPGRYRVLVAGLGRGRGKGRSEFVVDDDGSISSLDIHCQ